jgi:acetyl-CoA carboxylase carboxyl transferase alpha subunit
VVSGAITVVDGVDFPKTCSDTLNPLRSGQHERRGRRLAYPALKRDRAKAVDMVRMEMRQENPVDTAGSKIAPGQGLGGAFPGIEAEARGQAEAIARSIEAGLDAPVPFIATIIGEGGSGGAIALAAADRVVMLEHAVYSVISPEGCASILWRDAAQASTAAEALRLTAEDLRRLNLVDAIVAEPLGGAHRNADALMAAVGDKVWSLLEPLLALDGATLRARRREKFLEMGRGGVM